jgi:hypothetical protein
MLYDKIILSLDHSPNTEDVMTLLRFLQQFKHVLCRSATYMIAIMWMSRLRGVL